ncbi:hypothetical protein I552_3845 [Mycobacterium xenopi 3993]|nr:hypothetical protein I552_3845 [Mycobacterium xenopi 3993]
MCEYRSLNSSDNRPLYVRLVATARSNGVSHLRTGRGTAMTTAQINPRV